MLENNDDDIRLCREVQEKGYPNRWGARVQVKSRWNLQLFEQLLSEHGYEDMDIVQWL